MTCIISSAYLYIYISLTKNIQKIKKSVNNTKSTINSYLYLHLCLEYSWWYGWYVWCICSPSNHLQDSVWIQKNTHGILGFCSYQRCGVCVGPSTMACTSRGSWNCSCWWIWKSGVICKMQVICYSITSFQVSRLNSCFCGLISWMTWM